MSVGLGESSLSVETSDYAPLDETELVRRAKRGEHAAFAELDRRHRAKLVNYVARRVANRHDAEDLAQEAILRAFEKIHQKSDRRGFSSWLFAIAVRAVADFARKPREAPLGSSEDVADRSASDPARGTQNRESQDNLFQLAARVLTNRQFAALWMRYVDDLSIDEIAAELRCTKVCVRVTLHRARGRLTPYLVAGPEPREENGSTSP
ncbi:MAG: RNA polymerase sigma factor [Planctomycetota bacterium]|jgi:RNA polymerase sigma-70 factor (ECF subfamily)